MTKLEEFINYISENAPEFLANIMAFAEEFEAVYTGVPEVVNSDNDGDKPLNLTDDDGTASYVFNADDIIITNAEKDTLRNGLADGIVKEKAAEWVKGFITGLMISA